MNDSRIPQNSADFANVFSMAQSAAATVEGYLTVKERALLTLFASYPTAPGAVLEIGAFKGLSTVLLASALRSTKDPVLHSCDPWAAPGVANQDLRTDESTYQSFLANLKKAGVSSQVRVHRSFSHALAKIWRESLRFLWIDGDHSAAGTEQDYDDFAEYVVPRGIVAFHDVLHLPPGPSMTFATRVLASEKWAACGFAGSIGWAQRAESRENALSYREQKRCWLHHLISMSEGSMLDGKTRGWSKIRNLWHRRWIPHGMPDFERIVAAIGASCG